LYSYHSLTTGFGSFGNYRRFCSCIIISIIVIALGPVINVQSNYLITDLQFTLHISFHLRGNGMQLTPLLTILLEMKLVSLYLHLSVFIHSLSFA